MLYGLVHACFPRFRRRASGGFENSLLEQFAAAHRLLLFLSRVVVTIDKHPEITSHPSYLIAQLQDIEVWQRYLVYDICCVSRRRPTSRNSYGSLTQWG